jgi:hypothetical protein
VANVEESDEGTTKTGAKKTARYNKEHGRFRIKVL